MSTRSLGQVAFEEMIELKHMRQLREPGQIFTLTAAKSYPETDFWQGITASARSDWEHIALVIVMHYETTNAPAA